MLNSINGCGRRKVPVLLPKLKVMCAVDLENLQLPLHKHVPGRNARPVDGYLESIAALAPGTTSNDTAAINRVWLFGLELFNHGYYWECHEVLEAVWLNSPPNSRERFLLQGVIHLTNAALKSNMQRDSAVKRLLLLASECFDRAFPEADGVLMGLQFDELKLLASRSPTPDASISYQ